MDEPPSIPSEPIHLSTGDRISEEPVRQIIYVSELIGAPIREASGRTIGRIKDVVARVAEDSPAPVVGGLITRRGGGETVFVKWESLAGLSPGAAALKDEEVTMAPFVRRPGEILLVKDLRDKEIVDIEGERVARVNDLGLEMEEGEWIVAGVDVSAAGLLAQLGIPGIARRHLKRELLPWDEVEMFKETVPVPLHVTHDKISRLHPADIAKLFHQLGYRQSSELLRDLPDSLAADVVEDLAPEYQATLLASLERGRAADILEEMRPDAAADVLNDILEEDPEAARQLVETMDQEEAEAIAQLRAYRDDTAGGLMTTDFVTLPASFTVRQAMDLLREEKETLPPSMDLLFVVSKLGSQQLVGVVSLRTLALADPNDLLESIMQTDVVVRYVHDSAREVARTIAHYNLVALPILDANEQLVGVVPINAAMDVILPREWMQRVPRPFIGGRSIG
ncbi:MAG TPA: CBS domain-containing protein [Armatimonadota bacterium]|nr:CBS domain-containing protein [Armatimonadota bacterium]